MSAANAIGERGESIAYLRLTDYAGLPRPLFRPYFLGAKAQAVDFLVELEGVAEPLAPYFFVQVKATAQAGRKPGRNLGISVSLRDLQRLMHYPAPTYILGIEERTEQGFILAVTPHRATRMASLPTRHPITIASLQALHAEVLQFWRSSGLSFVNSRFL